MLKSSKVVGGIKGEIIIPGDKSISHRSVIIPAISKGTSRISNILESEDVKRTINALIKLGVKIEKKDKKLFIYGNGLRSLIKSNKNLYLGNSGTSARLLIAVLSCQYFDTKITGDSSLSKRPMDRIINPLKMMGGNFLSNNNFLPIVIKGNRKLKPIRYNLNIPSAQIKSGIILASLHIKGKTQIIEKLLTRNHTEIMLKTFGANIKINKYPNKKIITLCGQKELKASNINIPGDFSSAAFFIVLTLLTKNSSIVLKNININPSRTGMVSILNLMGAKISFYNKKKYKGEIVGDIHVKNIKKLKGIKCPMKFNTSAIDEMLLLFLVSSISKGTSTYKNLEELNKKESKRLDWGIKILKMIGIKTKKISNHGIKIYGNPNLKLKKTYRIKSYLKDHRVYMVSVIAALTLGGKWIINDPDSIKSSFPSFNKLIKKLGGKIN